MKIVVRAFAIHREILGTGSLELELPEGATARAAFDAVFAGKPEAARLLNATTFARNREYVSGDTVLAAGDELAFIAPVAGG